MSPLEPTVPTSKSRAEDTCALTCSSHYVRLMIILLPFSHHLLTCLFSGCPKSLRDIGGQCTAADRGRISILCDLYGLELVHPDLDSPLHPSNCADGPMATIKGEKRYVGISRELHLCKSKSFAMGDQAKARTTYGLCDVALSTGNHNHADGRGLI